MRPTAARDAVITGLGAVSALADDCTGLWSAIVARRSGITAIRRFDTQAFTVGLGALVEQWADPQPASRDLTGELCKKFAAQALREALASASLDGASRRRMRVALVLGTGVADIERRVHEIAEALADEYGLTGPRLTVCTACSSSTAAIGLGRDLLSMDASDVVIAGGSDVLTPEVFAGFHSLGVLSPGKCAPFSSPAGTTLGEGAGFLVLERSAHAAQRGARIIAGLTGYGLAGDGWHETSPEPKGAGVERAIRSAVRDAVVEIEEIDYVNVHGSGTEANDLSEWLGVQRAMGTRAHAVPVSSTKGALGHAQGAAGVLETIVTLLAMEHDTIPPTLNFTTSRAQAPTDPVATGAPRTSQWRHALKLNSAFGGSNASLLLARTPAARAAVKRSPVGIVGIGEVGPQGLGPHAFGERVPAGRPARRVAPFAIDALIPDVDPRGLDPASRFLTAAAALALRDAGMSVRGPLRDRAGLMVGQLRGSPASINAFERSIEERGLRNLSPSAFARIVLNAAAGACSKALSLRGPLSAITTGPGSGLIAVVLAAELLATRSDTDLMVAAGCDECAEDEDDRVFGSDEGAVGLVLVNARGLQASRASVPLWLAGWAMAGPDEDAVASLGSGTPARVPTFRAEDMPGGPATAGAVALAEAVRSLRAGVIEHALVTSSAGRSASAAILLARHADP